MSEAASVPARTAKQERRDDWIVCSGTMIVAAISLWDSLLWRFGYDQGTFAYGGNAILRGLRPYLDFWDIKPPSIFYTYAAAISIFGNSVFGVRLFDYLVTLLTVGLIWGLAAILWRGAKWRRLAATFAAFTFVICYIIQGYQNAAQVESYSLPFLLVAVLIVFRPKPRLWHVAVSGVLIGISFFYKYTNGLFILLPACEIWYFHSTYKKRIESLIALGLLFVIAVALQIAIMPSGAFAELWKITTTATLEYNRTNFSGSFSILRNLRTSIQMFNIFDLAVGVIGLLLLLVKRPLSGHPADRSLYRDRVLFLLIGVILSLVIVQAQNKGYTYHYAVLLPWAAILLGVGSAVAFNAVGAVVFGRMGRHSESARGWKRVLLFVAYATVFASITCVVSLPVIGSEMIDMEMTYYSGKEINGYIAGDGMSDYVMWHTGPSDKIFIFGFDPYVYWHTNREPANRFLNTIHFKPSYVAPELREELVNSLLMHPPKLIFVETGDHYTSQGDNNDDSWTMIKKRYPEIENLLATRYSAPDTVSDVLAFHLRHTEEGVR